MSTPNIDDVAQTLAEYERLAIGTGAAVRIEAPEFSSGEAVLIGNPWAPFWIGDEPPKVARVTVHRDGIPTEVYVAWDEAFPAEESWRSLWLAKPMKLFGAYVVRAALRRAFRDAIGDRREPDEQLPAPKTVAETTRDWDAEILAATTADAVNALHVEMKQHRVMTVAREIALGEQLRKAAADAWDLPIDLPPTPDETAPAEKPARPETRDHLPPTNRAARRANARKKGSRR